MAGSKTLSRTFGRHAFVTGQQQHAQSGGSHLQQVTVAEPLPQALPKTRNSYDRFVKPAIDRVAAAVLILVLSPVMLAVALTVWIALGSPVIIRQPRVGREGRVFPMIKFRTMHPDRRREQRPVPPHKDNRLTHKSAHDPRHTAVGRFLRRASLDELPQLINVLFGHMSLVGPRPELSRVVESIYQPWQLRRHAVKPGITGLWQVTRRTEGNADMHLHTQDDLEYIDRQSLWLDLSILVRTPFAVLALRRSTNQ